MRNVCSIPFALLLSLLVVPGVHAIDEGQTFPKLSKASLTSTEYSDDLIPVTNGSGNVKGIACEASSNSVLGNVQVHFYVDGSSARTVTLGSGYPLWLDSSSRYNTGIIPMNIRFESSIRIGIQRSSFSSEVSCMASWALD